MTTERALGPVESAVVNALRRRAWRWLDADRVVALARTERPVRRRAVLHHLGRLEGAGLVERTTEVLGWLPADERFRWAPDPPFPLDADGSAPLGTPPTVCPAGHGYDQVAPDGVRVCAACGRDEDGYEVVGHANRGVVSQ